MSLPVLKSSAGLFHKPVRKPANCGLKVYVCGFANRCLTASICGFAVKKLKSTANPQINNITEIALAISIKIRFYDSVYRQVWVDVILKYNTLSPSSSAVEQLFSRGAAILTAKWVGLRSRNFQRFRRVARNSQRGGCFGGLVAEPPELKNFAFFYKNNLIWGLFW